MAPTVLQALDRQLEQLFADWNTTSSILAALLVVLLFAPLFIAAEPDVHPFLLARQAAVSPVRQPGESGVYRSLETPHGYPLRSGLGVKDADAPRWATGRDGDLRDVWREAARGDARLITLRGNLPPASTAVAALAADLNTVGRRIAAAGGTRVAIYLPNSVEFLVALFACAFYGFTPILIAPNQPLDLLRTLLLETRADVLIGPAGALSSDDVLGTGSTLKHVVWVVEEPSRHMDFSDESTAAGRSSIWHQLVADAGATAATALPETAQPQGPPGVVHVWQGAAPQPYQIVEHQQKNIVAAIAAQLSCLPRAHRLSASDTLLSLCPLTASYPLAVTLAGLYSHSAVALLSATSADPDYGLARPHHGVHPTAVIASSGTMAAYLAHTAGAASGLAGRTRHRLRARRLARGQMPFATPPAAGPAASPAAGPRLLYVPYPASRTAAAAAPPLTAADLTALRIRTGARVLYALCVPAAAGALAQSHALDYRAASGARRAHCGAPLPCVELRVRRTAADGTPAAAAKAAGSAGWRGWLVAGGPAVAGAEEEGQACEVGVQARVAGDGTIEVL